MWSNESEVGKKNGPLPETGVGVAFGGDKTQRHRIAEQAQPTSPEEELVRRGCQAEKFTKEKCHVPGRLSVLRPEPQALQPP